MIISPKSNDTNLKDLLVQISQEKIKLPEFQRGWVWNDDRIRGIIASISQGYPMGAIMFLQYGNTDIKFKYHQITGVPGNDIVPEFLVLDGQQRLTSIYQALFSNSYVETTTNKDKKIKRYYYLSMEDCLNDSVDRLDAVLSVPEDRKIKENFNRDIKLDLSDREKEYENKCFPLNIIFNITKITQWQFGYMTKYRDDAEALSLLEKFQKEILTPILEYKLPVITLDKTTPREAVCKVFENVNTGGVELTVFELVTAIFATYTDPQTGEGFDLRKDWDRSKKIIQGTGETLRTDILDGIDETAFLTTVTLYTSYIDKQSGKIGGISCKKKDVLSLNYYSYCENKDKVIEGFKIAKDFLLKYQYIFRDKDLPYTTQLIPLAAICAVLGKSRCSEPNVLKVLTRWYWCGILGEMYGGANETRYANDIEDVIDEVNGKPNSSRTVNAAFFSATRLLTLQTRLSAAYKGIMALIYKEQCHDFMNDTTMNIANCLTDEIPDIHHIFPEAYCEKQGIERLKYNSVVNKTPILFATNRSIGGNAPSVYIDGILKKVDGLTEDQLKTRIESHLINYEALKANDFDTYFIDRAKKLLLLVEKAMGKTVSDKNSENTVEQFGCSLE